MCRRQQPRQAQDDLQGVGREDSGGVLCPGNSHLSLSLPASHSALQTEDEQQKGLPVVMPQFDRASCSIPRSQIGFYDFFIHDMFNAWSEFSNCPELLSNISSNYTYWKDLLEE